MSKQTGAMAQTEHESEWRNRLTRYSTSGRTVRAFCQSESVSTGTFYYWQARLRKRGFVVSAPPVRRRTPATFIDAGAMGKVGIVGHQAATGVNVEPEGGFDIRLELGGGIVLHLARH
jgi:hypothetical protein